ncbi:MAG TPA: HEAT repeat domain-containing protein, partial [Myxococcales bacterium]|nr:HEAT repeat domain-containing protein [Myxococcales bacterium]
KDLATISFLTAEDIVQAPWTPELTPQENGFFASPPASFKGLVEKEKSRAASGGGARPANGPPAAGENLKQGGGLVGFEVTDDDRKTVADELTAERGMDDISYVLSMVKAILECEAAPDVLSRGLSVVPGMIDALLTDGNWPSLTELLAVIEGVADVNPDFEPTHRIMAQRVLQSVSLPIQVGLIEKGLNSPTAKPLASLPPLLSRLDEHAVAPLCGVLAGVEPDEPRAILRESLVRIGRSNPEPVLKGLADERPAYVRDLIAIIGAWQLPQTADALAMVVSHASPEVRADAISAIARVHPSGDGAPLLAYASDKDEDVRQHALRTLATGRYTLPFEAWAPHLTDREAIVDLTRAQKRLLFQALRATAGDGAVPFWEELLTGRGWKQRTKKEETALLAIKVLVSLGTPRAREALDLGRREGSSPVRKACAAELEKA